MAVATIPNRSEFERVRKEIESGEPLTFTKMARVFGWEVYELVLMALLSAEAAGEVVREATQEANKEADGPNGN